MPCVIILICNLFRFLVTNGTDATPKARTSETPKSSFQDGPASVHNKSKYTFRGQNTYETDSWPGRSASEKTTTGLLTSLQLLSTPMRGRTLQIIISVLFILKPQWKSLTCCRRRNRLSFRAQYAIFGDYHEP